MNMQTGNALDAGSLAGLRILLVDDSPEVLFAFAELLQMEGAQVCAVQSGREALLAPVPEHGFDLLISDISMPDMDGHELLARLRAAPTTACIPSIALSGLGGHAHTGEGRFDRYLGKPIMFDVLLETIQALKRAP